MSESPTSPQVASPLTQELFDERMRIWKDLMDTWEKLLLAALRHKIGPDGDLIAAYQDWRLRDRQRRRREAFVEHLARTWDHRTSEST